MSRSVFTDLDFNSVARIINLPDATLPQHPATKAQLDAAIEGLAWKDSARVATQSNINLSSPGATIDSITMTLGDRVLVRAQSTASQNGVYIWNGATSVMTRAGDVSTAVELEMAVLSVEEGTSAGVTYRQTAINFTLDSGAVAWTTFGSSAGAAAEGSSGIIAIATQATTNTGTDDTQAITAAKLANWSGRIKKYATSIGDGASTLYTVTHNLGTLDVHVSVFRNSDGAEVIADVVRGSVNTVAITFASAPASNAYRVVVIG